MRWAASHFHRKVVKCSMDVFQLMAFIGFSYMVYKIGYTHGYKDARKNRPGSGK